jgi:hypothetical protein
MQLVRLGADPSRKLSLCNAPDSKQTRGYRAAGFDGKTALELAKELVELMEQHMRYNPRRGLK